MMISIILIIGFVIVWAFLLPPVAAESIYKWVNKDGVIHFSSDPPPPGVEHLEQFESISSPKTNRSTNPQRRLSYDAMVEAVKRDAHRNRQDRLNYKHDKAKEKKSAAEKKLLVKVEAEQQRLNQLIEKAQNRVLRKSYRRGMRQRKVDALKKQLDHLNASPKTYFEDKARQGAADKY